jgi:hypothetical protein
MPKRCGKMIQKGIMPEARPCLQTTKRGHKCTPDLKGMRLFNYIVLRRAPDYVHPLGGRQTRWYIRDAFGQKRIISARHIYYGSSRGLDAARFSGLGAHDTHGHKRPEYETVTNHAGRILNPKNPAYWRDKDMPFFNKWNPAQGGSYITGMRWIIKNLGYRPSPKHSLDIIKHHLGFVPGNLRWTLKDQGTNKRHRTMFLLTIEQHAEALRQLGYGIHKLR